MSGAGQARAARRARLLELIEHAGAGALLLERPANFAWYTGDGESRVDFARAEPVARVLVTGSAEYVLTSTIEGPRMRAEQTPGMTVVEHPWEEGPGGALRELTEGALLASDSGRDGTPALTQPIDELRHVLDAEAIERLRGVGAALSAALSEAAAGVRAGMSEQELAGDVARACRSRDLVPTVVLAAGDERVRAYRHPVASAARIARRAMVAASAARGGLYANLTRMAWLEQPTADDLRRQAACEEILARTRGATRPGRTIADVFADIRRFYADAGFADEWRRHHQGGTTGYASREIVATPHTHQAVREGMAFSWNPSVEGAKAEETFVLTAAGPEPVTGAPG